MRKRTDEINVRVYKTEKSVIQRKAKQCGMNMSEYLRTLGVEKEVKAAPTASLMQAYQKLRRLNDSVRYDLTLAEFSGALSEIESLLLKAYHGEEDTGNGGDKDLGNP